MPLAGVLMSRTGLLVAADASSWYSLLVCWQLLVHLPGVLVAAGTSP